MSSSVVAARPRSAKVSVAKSRRIRDTDGTGIPPDLWPKGGGRCPSDVSVLVSLLLAWCSSPAVQHREPARQRLCPLTSMRRTFYTRRTENTSVADAQSLLKLAQDHAFNA
jgi:hypothetical protein